MLGFPSPGHEGEKGFGTKRGVKHHDFQSSNVGSLWGENRKRMVGGILKPAGRKPLARGKKRGSQPHEKKSTQRRVQLWNNCVA